MKIEKIYVEENDTEYDIIIGTCSTENDTIIKQSNQNDIWFHFQSISGPHIILRSNGDIIPKRYLNKIASLLFIYKPKAPKNQNVIYTTIKNVKLTNTPGTVYTKNTQIIKM
jgi:predicted ribosome quality control (RQC) complex YloA/Tae2 family protein